MSKRLWRVTVALTALATAACPYDRLLTSNGGLAISGGGGGGSGPTNSITMTFAVNNVGARLSGTLSVVPVNGIASFGDLVVDKSASGFILQAAGAGALSKTSTPFTIFSP